MRILPSVTSSSPAIMRRTVLFPQPDGPRSTRNSSSATSRFTSSTATTSPKRFPTPSSDYSAHAMGRLGRSEHPDRPRRLPTTHGSNGPCSLPDRSAVHWSRRRLDVSPTDVSLTPECAARESSMDVHLGEAIASSSVLGSDLDWLRPILQDPVTVAEILDLIPFGVHLVAVEGGHVTVVGMNRAAARAFPGGRRLRRQGPCRSRGPVPAGGDPPALSAGARDRDVRDDTRARSTSPAAAPRRRGRAPRRCRSTCSPSSLGPHGGRRRDRSGRLRTRKRSCRRAPT